MDRNNRNLPRAGSSRRNDLSGSRDNIRNRNARLEPAAETRNATFLDEVVLSAIIRSGMMESIRPVNSAQFRSPVSQAAPYLEQSDSFGSHVDTMGGWMPRNINLANLTAQHQNVSRKPKDLKPELFENDDLPLKRDNRFLLPKLFEEEEQKHPNKEVMQRKKEWVSKLFDDEIERHLEKLTVEPIVDFAQILKEKELLPMPKDKMSPTTKKKRSKSPNSTKVEYQNDEKIDDKVDEITKVTPEQASTGYKTKTSKALRKAITSESTVNKPETLADTAELAVSAAQPPTPSENPSDETRTVVKSKGTKKKTIKSKTSEELTSDAKQTGDTEETTSVIAGSSKQKSVKNEQ